MTDRVRQLEIMKRIIAIFMAITLIVGLTNCRKREGEVLPYNNKVVSITLNVDGARTNVNTVTGDVSFEDGDVLLVANNGVYVGSLTYNEGQFSGNITGPDEDDYLHFYHLGNLEVKNLKVGKTDTCSVVINDQMLSLPIISYGRSGVKFSSEVSSYSAKLRNKCALVRFDVTTESTYYGVCLQGMNNKVFVNFGDASFTYSKKGEGNITLPPGSGERWAVLLPQEQQSAGTAFSGTYAGSRGAMPAIEENLFLPNGIAVTVNTRHLPSGALPQPFTVNDQGKQVYFSQGKLVYSKSTNKWYFQDSQYNQVLFANDEIGTNYGWGYDTEHFSWGASGYNHGAAIYQPWVTNTDSKKFYAYGDPDKDLFDGNEVADWGQNAISNGGDAYKQWRTLTMEEWDYILNVRDGHAQKRAFASVTVDDVNRPGLLLLPDDWSIEYTFNYDLVNFEDNVFDSESELWRQMESAGAVFLLCGGKRSGYTVNSVKRWGHYWTSTHYDATNIYSLYFTTGGVLKADDLRARYYGMNIRLVVE